MSEKDSAVAPENVVSPEEALLETSELASIVLGKVEVWAMGLVEMLPNLVVASLVVALASLVARIGGRLFRRLVKRTTGNDQLSNLAGATFKVALFAAGVFVALGLLNLDKTVTSLLAGVGVVGLALGFAFQDIAANFMSGVIMAARRPFETGDLVQTHDTMGTVSRVTLRATVVENFDGQTVIIPNKDVLQNPIVNYTQTGKRRVELVVGVDYSADLERARSVAIEAVEGVEGCESSEPVVGVYQGFGASSIDLSLRFWIDVTNTATNFLEARSAAIIAVKKAYDEAGIGIPFPIRTLDFGSRSASEWARQIRGDEPAETS